MVDGMKFKDKNGVRVGISVGLLMLMMLSGSLWARGVYTWTDDNGVINYSDRMRAQNQRVAVINVKVRADIEDESESIAADGNAATDAGKVDQAMANARASKAQKQLRKANCHKAREQLAANESMARMYRAGKNGERQYLSDKERGAVIKRALESVKYWCNG